MPRLLLLLRPLFFFPESLFLSPIWHHSSVSSSCRVVILPVCLARTHFTYSFGQLHPSLHSSPPHHHHHAWPAFYTRHTVFIREKPRAMFPRLNGILPSEHAADDDRKRKKKNKAHARDISSRFIFIITLARYIHFNSLSLR